MKVLVACEYSGRVRDAFTKRGHDALSCDLLDTDSPGKHYTGDVFDLLNEPWDLIIAHPPCTALTVAGNRTYGEGKAKYPQRLEACEWTEQFWNKCKEVSPRVCFENPVGVLPRLTSMPKPSYVQPYQFGHPEQKKTGLFLHNLPPLEPTDNVYEYMMTLPKRERERIHYLPPSPDRWKIRSITFQGIADAMADQWGSLG
ncbi:hypothetical protein [Endozoicomonas ascidiicola]|uniref:hypothetical protein n=1 Tax=Endozoicomonas ascidiicola TaxID=1698521 RepID=UPI0008295813|nr:hypothetical protein [Endozoicomonas ascidiicola]